MRPPGCLCVCVPHNFFVFYVVLVVSKESKRLGFPRNSCLWFVLTYSLYYTVVALRSVIHADYISSQFY
jgi:hypothetical protein